MARIHTHYDNLKVARNAPPEVIRAAYKTLSQKYHPDRNPDRRDAIRIIQIINSAYAVLSDPVKRQEHDEWIAREEAAETRTRPHADFTANFNNADKSASGGVPPKAPFPHRKSPRYPAHLDLRKILHHARMMISRFSKSLFLNRRHSPPFFHSGAKSGRRAKQRD